MIRTAAPQDEAAIRQCARRAYEGYIPLMGREPAPMAADFAAQIAAGLAYVYLGENGAVQGYIVFYPQNGHMLLESVAVLPEASGRGMGKALIAFCEAEARRLRLNAVCLYTNEKMTANLSIYPRLGYTETGRRTEDGFRRVFFEKRLS